MIHRLESLYREGLRLLDSNEWIVRLLGYSPDIANQRKQSNQQQKSRWRQGLAGLVMIQIDGLSNSELQKALSRREMPFLSRLLEQEHYTNHSLYSGLPSSTPAVQAELFYGVKCAVPAFAFKHHNDGQLNRMYDFADASRIEEQLKQKGTPLLKGGSAYCNIYTGGASEPHFCASSLGWGELLRGVKPLSWLGIAALNFPKAARLLLLLLFELLLGISDLIVGLYRGQRFLPEFKFVLSRVAISILLRDLITMGAKVDIARGLPVIHLNYIGYDEQAHRRGPASRFAHWTLSGIDRSIENLWKSTHQSRYRHYEFWIYSDHGQEATTPFEKQTGQSIKSAVRNACQFIAQEQSAALNVMTERRLNQRALLLGGRRTHRVFPHKPTQWSTVETALPDVIAMGPVGHIYLKQTLDFDSIRLLAETLVQREGVPMAVYRSADGQLQVCHADGHCPLQSHSETVFGNAHPYRQEVAQDLAILCQHEDAGDLVILGWSKQAKAVSFPDENGAHAGPGQLETDSFALLPADTPIGGPAAATSIRPLDLRKAALHVLGRDTAVFRPPLRQSLPGNNQSALRVMTYNVHSCIGMDSKLAPERIARVIARYRPDVVALQELDVRYGRSNGTDQAQLLASLLEMKYHFHPAVNIDDEQYGDAILTRLPLRHRQAGVLPLRPGRPNCEPRGAIWVTVEFNGIEVQVINTHLGLFAAERRAQVEALMGPEWLGHPDCVGPVVFCGDLNALPSSPVLKTLKSRLSDVQSTLADHKPRNTFTGRFPTVRIDHILTDQIKRVHHVEVPATTLTRIASDHLPLIADLII